MIGRITADGLDLPPHPDGPAALDPRCASQGLRPCSAERWTDGEQVVDVVRAGHDLRIDGLTGRTDWLRIGPTLMGCLGDPLALPPADDPGGTRSFDGEWWTLHMSGANACRVSGELRLHAWKDQADWHALAVDGVPWDAGGRQRLSGRSTP